MNSKLAVVLCQVARCEQKIEICKQILAQQMNFSPAWLLAILKNSQAPQDSLQITELFKLFQIVGAHYNNDDIALIFDYFDCSKSGKISNKIFVECLLPTQKIGLRKAVLKRVAEDLEFTKTLKYSLKRLFSEILGTQKQLLSFECKFDHSRMKINENYQKLTKNQIQDFLLTYGKCLMDSQLSLIEHSVEFGKIKCIDQRLIVQLIREDLKAKRQSKNEEQKPLSTSSVNRQSRNPTFTRKGQKIDNSQCQHRSQQNEFEDGLKQTKEMATKLLDNNDRKHLTETPIQRIKQHSINVPKSYNFLNKNSEFSEVSVLQSGRLDKIRKDSSRYEFTNDRISSRSDRKNH